MGLAAGQARLLTITARKSDCEFQSMRLSHQKIALARELADISNEYQNSLEQTKLYYDYYGTGDTEMPLTYGVLMNMSQLNDYKPILLTDNIGRVTLNSKYAAAAKIAGIPQEGLGTLPSEVTRNMFIAALAENGVITDKLATTIQSLPYNQAAGFGGDVTVAVQTVEVDLAGLMETINERCGKIRIDSSNIKPFQVMNDNNHEATMNISLKWARRNTKQDYFYEKDNSDSSWDWDGVGHMEMDLGYLLASPANGYNDVQYYLAYGGVNGEQSPVYGVAHMQQYLTDTFIPQLIDAYSSVLDLGDGYSQAALEYASNSLMNLFMNGDDRFSDGKTAEHQNYWLNHGGNDYDGFDLDVGTQRNESHVNEYLKSIGTLVCYDNDYAEDPRNDVVRVSDDYVGFTYLAVTKHSDDDSNDNATAGINLNNIAKAFLTYYADFMNGPAAVDENGYDKYYVGIGGVKNGPRTIKNNDYFYRVNSLVTDDPDYKYTIRTGTDVSSDDCKLATAYDMLFNQICANGWTENNNVEDKEYLKQMLQSGMLYISKVKDDGYYYQGNYATDAYIKEVADETYIAQAESRYNTEKAKLNAKEETLDLKMKNLDTEISSLTTEYDTVKSTISKQIEKSFKRYDA